MATNIDNDRDMREDGMSRRMGSESTTARRAVRTHEKREHKAKSQYYRMRHGQAAQEINA